MRDATNQDQGDEQLKSREGTSQMKAALYGLRGVAASLPPFRQIVLLAALLALGVVAWQHFLHAYALGHNDTLAGHLTHSIRDAVLAFGPALIAAMVGFWLAQRLGLVRHTWSHLLGRAAIISITLALLMVPSVGVHSLMDGVLGGEGVASAAGASGHDHGGGLEGATGLWGLVLHGARDALIGQAVALPLTVAGVGLLALLHGAWPHGQRASATRRAPRRWARWALALAPAGVALIVVSVLAANWYGTQGPAQAQAIGPCPAGAPLRQYDVTAINVDIPLNRFGDHDPQGKMYVLTKDIPAVRLQEASQAVQLGLRDDPIQPLVIRANMDDCLEITFTNRVSADRLGIHIDGLIFDIDSSGDAVGNNPPSDVGLGATRTYRWFVPYDPLLEGSRYLHPGPGNREAVAHGLFGSLVVEPEGSTYLHPKTGQPMDSGWEAMIVPGNDESFREFVTVWHEVGNETYDIPAGGGGTLPEVDPYTESYRPGGKAINYRTEPFFNLMERAPRQESGTYSSYSFGDPPTPMPRSYLGDPVKMRIQHGGSEVFHVFHLHGGGIRWRQNPHADPTWDYADTGLNKVPVTQQSPSTRLDSQTIGPGESFDLQIEGGGGGVQQAAGEFLFHCHIAEHYVSGMWSFWRNFDTLQPDLMPLPDRAPPPEPVESSGLIGKTMADGTTLTADNLDAWIRPQLPPQGVSQSDQDASVLDWDIDSSDPSRPVYLGEPEDTGPFPNLPNIVPGHPGSFPSDVLVQTADGFRPKLMFNPTNGRPAFPVLRPHIGKRPPFSPNGHSGAPWLGERGDQPGGAGVDPWANRPDGLCPAGAPITNFNVVSIQLPIQVTAAGDTDPLGRIFVLAKDVADVRAGIKPAEPLAIRANIGDCVHLTLTTELTDLGAFSGFAKSNIHVHHIQFDVQGSDGVITGLNYETSVRPFKAEDPTLTSAVAAGDRTLALSSVAKFQPDVWIGIGLGTEGIEIHQIESINAAAGTVTLKEPVGAPHAAGQWAGVEFVQYLWFPDVMVDNVFFHDHVDTIHTVPSGLVGQFLSEPPGSTYHDPVTGEEVASGNLVDIHTDTALAPGLVDGSFREFVIHEIDGNAAADSTINLRAEPFNDRRGDPSLTLSSYTYGDPFTPLPQAYPGDPFVIRVINSGPRVDTLHVDGHRFALENRFIGPDGQPESTARDTVSIGISERFTLILLGGAGGIRQEPGDYLYVNTIGRRFADGAWGILRVFPCQVAGLQPLPGTSPPPACGFQLPTPTGGRPPVVADPGNPCPPGARDTPVSISAVDINNKQPGVEAMLVASADAAGVRDGTKPPEMRVRHVTVGECITVHFTNERDGERASLHVGRLRTALSSGMNLGFGPEQTVARRGGQRDYKFFIDSNLGALNVYDFGGDQTGKIGLYSVLLVHEAGATFTDPVTGAPTNVGQQVDVHVPGTPGYRDFTLLFADDDPIIGGSFMPYPVFVDQPALVNYHSEERLDDTNDAFSSLVNGDPETPVLRAYAGDPVKVHVIGAPGNEQVHVFSFGGMAWAAEPLMPGSSHQTSEHFAALQTFGLDIIGGAGGPGRTVGDFVYSDLRRPFTQGGMWGLMRVMSDTSCPIQPLDGLTCLGQGQDTIEPVITCPASITVVDSGGGVHFTDPAIVAFRAGASATDDTDAAPFVTNNGLVVYHRGVTTVTFTAADTGGNSSQCTASVTVVAVMGDVNGDGAATIADALILAQCVAGFTPCTGLGDVNGDAQETIADALLIAQFVAGLIPAL